MKVQQITILQFLYCWSLGGGFLLNRTKRGLCGREEYECADGRCIDAEDVCDGAAQCTDASDETPAACGIVCGQSYNFQHDVNGEKDVELGQHPWHVGIFRSSLNNQYSLICSGALIYSNIVLTSAHCVYDSDTSKPYVTSVLRVAAGKVQREFTANEKHQQNFFVNDVQILPGYDGDEERYKKNLAILKLKENSQITRYLKPICIWTSNSFPDNLTKSTVTGWSGSQSTVNLKQTSANMSEVRDCTKKYENSSNKRYLTRDKICLTFEDGISHGDEYSGGPVTVYQEGRHYLIGIISVKLSSTTLTLATRISKHIEWIIKTGYQLIKIDRIPSDPSTTNLTRLEVLQLQHKNRHQIAKESADKVNTYWRNRYRCRQSNHFNCLSDNGCIGLHQVCDGRKDCADNSDEDPTRCPSIYTPLIAVTSTSTESGDLKTHCTLTESLNEKFELMKCGKKNGCKSPIRVPDKSWYKITCASNRGFAKPSLTSAMIICDEGSWFPSINENRCLPLCKPLVTKSLRFTCSYQGNEVRCDKPLRPDTVINIQCQLHYKMEPGVNFASRTKCRSDGELAHVLTECIPVCGKEYNASGVTLISNGVALKYAKYPWHTALYWKNPDDDIDYLYQCGGFLIDTNKVLTAAHCIWGFNQKKNADELAVALGKYHSSWLRKDHFEQKIGVKEVIPGQHYNGAKTSHAADIAILILSHDVELSDYVMPVCLDLDNHAGGIPSSKPGHVTGWGRTDPDVSGSISDILHEAKMDYLSLENCRIRFQKLSFERYLNNDKFCALYQNGSGTQRGDSGGGITWKRNGIHYTYGVVSVKEQNQNVYAVFTDINFHAHWIKNILSMPKNNV